MTNSSSKKELVNKNLRNKVVRSMITVLQQWSDKNIPIIITGKNMMAILENRTIVHSVQNYLQPQHLGNSIYEITKEGNLLVVHFVASHCLQPPTGRCI